MTCGLPGHEREEKKVPTYKLEMGGPRKAEQFKRCPWSAVIEDPIVGQSLRGYGLVDRWHRWPEGRPDPRFLEALSVIDSEHNRITEEATAAARAKRPGGRS